MLNKNTTQSPKADVKDGALILYLPTALKPCVWRMELNTLAETSIEIDEKDGVYVLATRDINGVIKPISAFKTADEAQKALSLTLKALMNSSQSSNGRMVFGSKQLVSLLKWGLVLVVAFLIWTFLKAPLTMPVNTIPQVIEQETAPANKIEMGVPIDVDSLFEQTEE